MNRTLVLVKPQAIERGLTGTIINRYEAKGLRLAAVKSLHADESILSSHYAEHEGKPFYRNLLDTMQQGLLVALVLEGTDAVTAARMLNGATDPLKAAPGTIRGDFGLKMEHNVVHASDSVQNALREVSLWFPELV
ncbi:MAG: nucleoside-diphosphate kinase [Bacillota bacterium]|nr:nucleoside-diphosphate kinase [Bacillota bacterium]MDW7676878.1 nucleoside-diphosphate kinase [Bacillota bacterium]